MYMQEHDRFNDKEGIGLPAVEATSTFPETEYDRYLIRAHEFLQKQAKDL